MRLPLLLFIVVASALCYKINLYNDQSTDLTIKYNRNGVEKTFTLPAKTSNGPTQWTISKLRVNATITFAMQNLFADIRPTIPQGTPLTSDVTGGYLSIGTGDTNVAMNLFTPVTGAFITCNHQGLDLAHKCIKSSSGGSTGQPSQTLTIEYDDVGAYNIWFVAA